MKKPYSKPMVSFEDYSLDTPIAANCADIDLTMDLVGQGWFAKDCEYEMTEDFFSQYDPDNKLCYFSQAATLFTS